jgi:membrane-associated phospholipid phosphatase
MRFYYLLALLLISVSPKIYGQCPDSLKAAHCPSGAGAYFLSYLTDSRDILLSPLRPAPRRIAGYCAAAAGVGLLFTQDVAIQKYAQSKRGNATEWASVYVLEPWGSGVYSLPLLAAMGTAGVAGRNKKAQRAALQGVKAYVISGLFVRLPKIAFSRQRPGRNIEESWKWYQGPGNSSFVSGHTTSAFAVATIIAKEYRSTIWVPVLAYGIAGLSGLSRIHDNKHWASDVFGGAMLGYGISSLIHRSCNWNIKTVPVISAGNYGASILLPIGAASTASFPAGEKFGRL